MSDSTIEQLKQLTPSEDGLDRAAILIAAGRASARPGRLWKLLVAILAVAELTTLVVRWPSRSAEVRYVAVGKPQPHNEPVPPAVNANAELSPADRQMTLGFLRRHMLDDEGAPDFAPSQDLVPDDPPLRPFVRPEDVVPN
jgi:hypothetical protein